MLYGINMDVFQNWLNQLANELKLNEPLVLDEKNQCFLLFDEVMLVQIEYKVEEGVCLFKGVLGNVNEHKIKQIYPKLLEANLQWKETNGSTLGLQQYSEKVLLVQNVPIEFCDYNLFNRSLEFFINSFEFWLKNLKDLQTKSEKTREKPVGLLV